MGGRTLRRTDGQTSGWAAERAGGPAGERLAGNGQQMGGSAGGRRADRRGGRRADGLAGERVAKRASAAYIMAKHQIRPTQSTVQQPGQTDKIAAQTSCRRAQRNSDKTRHQIRERADKIRQKKNQVSHRAAANAMIGWAIKLNMQTKQVKRILKLFEPPASTI